MNIPDVTTFSCNHKVPCGRPATPCRGSDIQEMDNGSPGTSNFDIRILNPFLMDPDHVQIIGKWRQSVAKLFLAYWSMTRPRAKMTLGFGRTIQLVSI